MRRSGWCGESWRVAGALLVLGCLPAVPAAGQNINMGTYFHELEAEARRVTTVLQDARVVTERTAGEMKTTVFGRDGARVASFARSAGEGSPFTFTAAERPNLLVRVPLAAQRITADWANLQAYTLWKDAQAQPDLLDGSEGEWEGRLYRPQRFGPQPAPRVSAVLLVAKVLSVETEFEHVRARASLDAHTGVRPRRGVATSTFTSHLVENGSGKPLGFVRYFASAQVLTWSFTNGQRGVVLPERLPGGWTFTPDMAWANVQALAFSRAQAPQVQAQLPRPPTLMGLFARNALDGARGDFNAPRISWITDSGLPTAATRAVASAPDWGPLFGTTALASFAAVAAAANDVGCDKLHYLDGTVFRQCCDRHDWCYEKNGCTSKSWFWPFASNWVCQACNIQAVHCFCTSVGGCLPPSRGGSWDPGSNGDCQRSRNGWCPPECVQCGETY